VKNSPMECNGEDFASGVAAGAGVVCALVTGELAACAVTDSVAGGWAAAGFADADAV
jgi:hypothetical protein